MKILISGGTGLVGSRLKELFENNQHDVYTLTRKPSNIDKKLIHWDYETNKLDSSEIEGFDSIIHLAGENIAAGRWTKLQKQKIVDSRVIGTKFLVDTINNLEAKPKSFISASAIGFYGERAEDPMIESSASGSGFLSETCSNWENASDNLDSSIRKCHARLGIVMSPKGGALKTMLPIFLIGGGGILDSGKQFMSWIDIDDVAGGLVFLTENESCSGKFNFTAPEPVTNKVFTKILGSVIFRPTIFPVPGFMIKLIFGEMGEALLLSSTKVLPKALLDAGYEFKFRDLKSSLEHLLK